MKKAAVSCHQITFSLIACWTLSLLTGCATEKKLPPSYVQDIAVSYQFTNVDKPDERERVYLIAKSVAKPDTLVPKDIPTTPNFELKFVVHRLSSLDEAHSRILFVPATGSRSGEVAQTFNPRDPKFSIRYDTLNIGGGIEVIVRFRVTPGAQLFYKPQGGALVDITHQVGETGNVAVATRINRGQEYFYAKAISGGVTKWMKINIFSQQVQEITQSEFEGQR
jgi:hypothetical protein